ncbi:hypothetical protein DIS24_g3898 [Lasiodiplodia hormozganensis]|uniref:Uncharacterized protein n=1 Tax=Lasiodiplodia hormozganensis TaxID=869390 RepID=A0AA39YXL0_9PEZI|nr:hypothetical protein DIS24_g3898 [Lasiodiplodia hormozganensis]
MNESTNDLWVTTWNYNEVQYSSLIARNIDISVDGSYAWTIGIPSSQLSKSAKYVLRFKKPGTVYKAATVELSSPAFLILAGEAAAPSSAHSSSSNLICLINITFPIIIPIHIPVTFTSTFIVPIPIPIPILFSISIPITINSLYISANSNVFVPHQHHRLVLSLTGRQNRHRCGHCSHRRCAGESVVLALLLLLSPPPLSSEAAAHRRWQ